MTPLAERLRTAAERLDRLQVNATPAPWRGPESSWAGRIAVLSSEGHPVAVTSLEDLSVTATVDAGLIAGLRPLAPVIASQLRQHAVMAADVVPSEAGRRWHITDRCGLTLDPSEGEIGCDCFTDSIQLADAILGEAA